MSKLKDLKEIIDTIFDGMDMTNEAKRRLIKETATQKGRIRTRNLRLISTSAAAIIIIGVLFLSNIFGTLGMAVKAQDLMKGITPANVESTKLSDDFINSQADFAVDLFKKSIDKNKNSLISPTSVYLALAMTANGADGNTLKEFETVLGKYNLSIADINKYCNSYNKELNNVQSGKINIANSIWYKNTNNLIVNKTFLQTNADNYGASAYKSDFGSKQTVKDINNWVKSNTGGLIDNIVDKIDPRDVMVLFNTIYFEAEWQVKYENAQINDGVFKLSEEKTITTKFMTSSEYNYLKDDTAQGFIKPYKDNKFSFVAILPNEGVSIDSYIASLTGEKFLSLIKNKSDAYISTSMPKFKSDFSKSLVESLKEMGLNDCFDGNVSDFNNIASSTEGNIYVSDVMHTTFIQVDGLGTKAGAATKISNRPQSAAPSKIKITLDRPFIYAIIDNETSLPIFIGTMNDPKF